MEGSLDNLDFLRRKSVEIYGADVQLARVLHGESMNGNLEIVRMKFENKEAREMSVEVIETLREIALMKPTCLAFKAINFEKIRVNVGFSRLIMKYLGVSTSVLLVFHFGLRCYRGGFTVFQMDRFL